MARSIKISEKQYRKLLESNPDKFSYFQGTWENEPHSNGLSNITVDGSTDSININNNVITGDEIGNTITPQTYHRYLYGRIPRAICETDTNNADDFYETNTFNGFDLSTDNIQIPEIVKERMKLLIDTIKQQEKTMTPRKKANVLDYLAKFLSSSKTPLSWQKKRDKIVGNNNWNNTQLTKKTQNKVD